MTSIGLSLTTNRSRFLRLGKEHDADGVRVAMNYTPVDGVSSDEAPYFINPTGRRSVSAPAILI
jgi:hypothetical protein